MVKKKEIYLTRHGETDYNKNGKVQGRGIDAPLNKTGRSQAAKFFAYYEHENFDKVYTSALQRTHQSVEGFLNKGLEHTALEGLDEIDWGNKEGKSFSLEDHNDYLTMVESWKNGNLEHRIEGGESPLDVLERQKEAWNIILEDPSNKVLVCMHGRAMRILLSYLLNYELSVMDVFSHHNLCLYHLVYTGSVYQVKKFDDIAHLK
ncbi:MAG: histidine phosphatase family protein [Bacteroidota bacterium]